MQQFSSIYLVILFVVALSAFSEAKRGCALYGHSCYGGHGKRSEIDALTAESGSIPSEKLFQTDSKEAMFALNNNNLNGFNQQDNRNQNHFKYALYNLLRQWMDEARKSAETDRETETIYKNNYV